MKVWLFPLLIVALCTFAGCVPKGSGSDSDATDGTSTSDVPEGDTTGEDGTGDDTTGDDTTGGDATVADIEGDQTTTTGNPANRVGDSDHTIGAWSRSVHPCFGNRTDVMWFDDANTGFVGCGSTTEGYGIYETHDAGMTWVATPATPNVLGGMRVNSISRGADGLLYIGGTGGNGMRVVKLDTATHAVTEFYLTPSSGAKFWQTFQVGTFRIDSDGRAVSESLTGTDTLYWPIGAVAGIDGAVNGDGWWNNATPQIEGNGAQILDLELYGDRFFGVGSTINQPPYFFYEPAAGMGDVFAMEGIRLSPGGLGAFPGEVWDIDIDSNGDMLLSGVNEGSNVGTLWYNTGDVTVAANWTMFDVTPVIPVFQSNRTSLFGGCREGDLMVAVGAFTQQDKALILLSLDGGTSWRMTTPPGKGADVVGPLSKCQLMGDQVYVTGKNGFFGVLDIKELTGDLPPYTGPNNPSSGEWLGDILDVEVDGVYEHNLNEGATMDLAWASVGTTACWPETENLNFNGNHLYFGMVQPANTLLTVVITPEPTVDLSLYTMQQGRDEWQVPPDVIHSPLSCDASYDYQHENNPGDLEFVEVMGRAYDTNVLIGVAGAAGITEGNFTLEIFTTPLN